ncbi:hypothetical protein VKS41_004770 [Umbelopsis sp. WA50703]
MDSTLKQNTSQRKRSSFVSSNSNRTVSSLASDSADGCLNEFDQPVSASPPRKSTVKSQKPSSSPNKNSPLRSNITHNKSFCNVISSPNKAPWRPPGRYQIPDILKSSENTLRPVNASIKTAARSKKSHLAATLSSTNKIKHSPAPDSAKKPTQPQAPIAATNTPQRRPWIPVGRSPQVLPLPALPTAKSNRPHALFDIKMRKILPKLKIMDLNPREQYVGLTKIGSGANGAVVRASKRSNSKYRVAIKRCFIDDTDTPHLAYILREIRIMGCISHANLVGLKEATLWGDYVWLAMDLMSCSVFGLLCNISTGLPEPLAVCVLRECLQGLIHLHNKGYMHRDVKCENLLLSRSGEVKLGDFGLATPISRNNTARLGTAKWMSPEVIREIPYDEKVDVWSTAITLIEIMDRVPPLYYLESTDDIFAEILWGPPPHFTFASPSNNIRDIASWMLDQDARRRPGAKDVLQEINRQINDGYLDCASQADLAYFVQHVFDKAD